MIFKIIFQNYSLSVIKAHRSLAKRLRGREQGLGGSSGFSHLLGKEGGWVLIGGGSDSFSRVKSPGFRHFLLDKIADLHLVYTW